MIHSSLFIRRIAVASSKAVTRPNFGCIDAATQLVAINYSTSVHHTPYSTLSQSSTQTAATPTATSPKRLLPTRQFSSDAASTHLGSVLQREINEEEEASSGELPPELVDIQSTISTNWTILEGIQGIGGSGETGSGAAVRLFRKEAGSKGARKIGVVFHCQDTEEDIPVDENNVFEEINEEDEDEEPAQAVRFGVVVSKGGKTVVMQCRAGYDGDVSVESVMVRDGDTESVLSELAGGEGLHAALYQVCSNNKRGLLLILFYVVHAARKLNSHDDKRTFYSLISTFERM